MGFDLGLTWGASMKTLIVVGSLALGLATPVVVHAGPRAPLSDAEKAAIQAGLDREMGGAYAKNVGQLHASIEKAGKVVCGTASVTQPGVGTSVGYFWGVFVNDNFAVLKGPVLGKDEAFGICDMMGLTGPG